MSKKSKRMRARYKAGLISSTDSNEKKNSISSMYIKPSSPVAQRISVANQDSQYKYIVPELVRICIIAGIFFIIIIILSFIFK